MRKKLFYFLTIIVVLLASGCSMQAETVVDAETTADIDESIESIEDIDNIKKTDESTQVKQESQAKPDAETIAAELENILAKYNVFYETTNSHHVTVKDTITYEYDQDINFAPDASWQEHLRYFLAMNYPSLFHKAAMERKDEMYDLIHGDSERFNQFIAEGVPSDVRVLVFKHEYPIKPRFYLSGGYKFYDLNSDGIPEVVIQYYYPNTCDVWYEVCAFNGNSFERIGSLGMDRFYIDSLNRVVYLDGMRFLELIDNQMVFSEYIDPTGSKTYGGESYQMIWDGINHGYGDITATDLGLECLPEFDCSEIVESIF